MEAVVEALQVDARPGVAVVVPDAADVAAPLDAQHAHAHFSELVHAVDAAHAAADDNDIEVADRSAALDRGVH